ncbi:hypothetical protein ATANTOWER_014781 [Ataeniobius toweri]|uniref:Secreted protein n=1 Tax=Ataeniobius toweri TaxID=208326 RepID=A0ABU7AHE7_9TELE|nr:hypothetical protein [Ataeniobius toweri]
MLNFGRRMSERMNTFTSVVLRPAARTAVCLSNAIVVEATRVRTKCLLQLSIHRGILKPTKERQIIILRFCAILNEQPSSSQSWQMISFRLCLVSCDFTAGEAHLEAA